MAFSQILFGQFLKFYSWALRWCKVQRFTSDKCLFWVTFLNRNLKNVVIQIIPSNGGTFFKVWNLTNCKLKTNHYGHTGYLNTVTVSPDGSLCASGGKDGKAMLWDLNEGKHLYTLDGGNIINSLCFSPNRYWLCAATGPSIKIWVRFVFQFTRKYFRVNLEFYSHRFLVKGRPLEQCSWCPPWCHLPPKIFQPPIQRSPHDKKHMSPPFPIFLKQNSLFLDIPISQFTDII